MIPTWSWATTPVTASTRARGERFPANNVIGKSFFVYWPITERFGWGNQ